MSDIALMQMVAGKSPAASAAAGNALRAIRAGSPVVADRVARVATQALEDRDAAWTEEERVLLAEASGGMVQAHPVGESPARVALSTLLTDSGLSIVEMAGMLGRDERTVRRWLGGEMAIPGAAADQIERLRITGITKGAVRLEYRR